MAALSKEAAQEMDAPKETVLARLGFNAEPSRAAPYLRIVLAFLKEFGEEQLKQIPGVGPAVTALLELSKEADTKQLDARLQSLLAIGQETHEAVSLLAALAAATLFYQARILERLNAAGQAVAPHELTGFALSAAVLAYRNRTALDYLYTDYRGVQGVSRQEHVASLRMETVYVTPRLVPETGSGGDGRGREESVLRELENQDLTPDERMRLEEEYAVLTGMKWKGEAKGDSAPEVLARVRHTVILGGPGVGKSAFTRYLARACALGPDEMRLKLGWAEELTPIILSLAGFADARRSEPTLPLRYYFDRHLVDRGGEALRLGMTRELQEGHAFVLLDGVDEIPDSSMRGSIVRAVERFIADHSNNRVLVTSRPFGYIRLGGEILHYVMPNFTKSQVKTFVTNWQRAFEQWQHPVAPNLARADAESEAMLAEINRNQRVMELATNPLVLVIVSLIRQEGRRLPEKRVQLYDRAVRTLLETWNQWRSQSGIDVGGARLPAERLIRVWGAIAEWTRRTKPTGVVHRMELRRELTFTLQTMEFDEESPEATAESYLNAAADRAGLLEERGCDIFAFWHPTFEEFLAAVDLTTPTSKSTSRLLPLRRDPRWREVILLAVGYVGVVQHDSETATEIVRSLWEQGPSALEPVFHDQLRLAAACIADDVGVKRTLAQQIIVRLAEVVLLLPYEPFICWNMHRA